LELTCEGRLAGQRVMNVFHYFMQLEGGVDDGHQECLDLMNTLQAGGGFWDKYLACLSADCIEMHMYAQWITDVRFAYVTSPVPDATGLAGQPALPPNDGAAITLRGDLADRHNLGRKAIPGVFQDYVVNGNLVLIYFGLLEDFCDKIVLEQVNPSGAEYLPIIFNRATPELSPVITEAFPQHTSRVERRRTVGVGA